ncbi:hypothetical protein EUX98_g2267 [Antrodiella citrinella]|uniref:AB hydrolase-1 domain-containing protein n=1 Tax=Antrodiella citrinella TaxID=2447956 RepID=A0A4S4N2B7_9APHY|nr:hypothetical protein EUX98_g2267 [Antrodiella citrinella]
MPLVPVDDNVTVFQYEDTGPPPTSDTTPYTTWVLIHGIQFHSGTLAVYLSQRQEDTDNNSGIFSKLLPYAAPNNLRRVHINLRDNGQSTLCADEELVPALGGDKEAQVAFMKCRGLELASFLAWFSQHEHIPPMQEVGGKRVGGLCLVVWSGANAFGLSFFGFAEIIPRDLIERYLRTYVILDAAPTVISAPTLTVEEMYNILLDPAATSEQKLAAWVPKSVGRYS